ncbi:hypothetical protein [Erwinia aphidicola]|uniref:hypothetical protein n=1 Tax=Erwinia aphidicola TaxID=68334 RepID=UPI003015C2A7
MKKVYIAALLILSGCSTDSTKPHPKSSDNKSYPGIMTRPSADNRRAIMSGERPDWEADKSRGVRVLDW